ncbi:hypothetical protein D3C84_422630 [compost metagenome]
MLPADQRFQLADLCGLQVENRLVMQDQPGVFMQGVAQFLFELQLQRGSGFQVRAEEIQAIAAAALGLVQRQVGVFQQFLAGGAILRKQADADAGGHDHAPPGQLDRFLHLQHDALGHGPCFLAFTQADEEAELVTAETRHHIFVTAYRPLDVLGQDFEQFVAGVVAEAVVDPLEVVDVQKHHREHAAFIGFLEQLLGENLVEAAAVDQVGQGVIVRHFLQRHSRLIQLAEQRVDPLQVAFLVLQFLVRQCCADAAADDQ